VDDTTNEVYGHVVASDVFGVAYVVPIDDIFEDIKLRLSLEVVDLPWTRDPTLLPADPPLKEFRQILDRQDTAVGSPSKQPLVPVDQARSGKELPEPSDRLQSSTTSPETHLQEVPFKYGASQPSFNIYTQPDRMDSYLPTLPYTQQYPTVPDPYAQGYQIIGIQSTTVCDPETFVPYPPYVGYVPPKDQRPYPDSGYSTMNNSPAPSPPQQNSYSGVRSSFASRTKGHDA